VLVAVAGVVEFCATSEVLKNQRCRNVLALAFKRKTDAILLTRRLVFAVLERDTILETMCLIHLVIQ
jgi:hypothetical protein